MKNHSAWFFTFIRESYTLASQENAFRLIDICVAPIVETETIRVVTQVCVALTSTSYVSPTTKLLISNKEIV